MIDVKIDIYYYLEDEQFREEEPVGDYVRMEAEIKVSQNTFENTIKLKYGDWYHDKSEDKIEGVIKALELMFNDESTITKSTHWTTEYE